MGKLLVLGLVGLFSFSGFAAAQQLTVSPTPLVPGEKATVSYSDPKRAGETVTVTIDDGGLPVPSVVELYVRLDQNGVGSVSWDVPRWLVANFGAPGVRQFMLVIE
jgi:hypothetical protein